MQCPNCSCTLESNEVFQWGGDDYCETCHGVFSLHWAMTSVNASPGFTHPGTVADVSGRVRNLQEIGDWALLRMDAAAQGGGTAAEMACQMHLSSLEWYEVVATDLDLNDPGPKEVTV